MGKLRKETRGERGGKRRKEDLGMGGWGFNALVAFTAEGYLVCAISLLRMRWTPATHCMPPTRRGVGWQL